MGGERRRFRLTLITAEIATAVVAAWTAVIAPLLIDYLGPILNEAGVQFATILAGRRRTSVGTPATAPPRPPGS